ncbi:hypothetical protein ACFWBB_08135 [Streptomyces sp. NPDC060000]|uniref:hypothetical protein n=1 Tax=Streptomyces sp. NPDC060000 TaxID=3347031 RepID=UPI0036B00E48
MAISRRSAHERHADFPRTPLRVVGFLVTAALSLCAALLALRIGDRHVRKAYEADAAHHESVPVGPAEDP